MFQPIREQKGSSPIRLGPAPTLSTTNRRTAARHTVVEDEAWLGWWEGHVYRRSRAALIDISQGGAKLYAEKAPPRRSTVWICLDGERRTDWIEASVAEVSRFPNGLATVRIAFREVCPYSFFEAAVYGQPPRDTLAPIPSRVRI